MGQYLVMDYIEGKDRNRVLAHSGPAQQAQAQEWMRQVLNASRFLSFMGFGVALVALIKRPQQEGLTSARQEANVIGIA